MGKYTILEHKKGPLPYGNGPSLIYAITHLLLPCRQRFGTAHDFENLGRDGRLTRPVTGQLAGL